MQTINNYLRLCFSGRNSNLTFVKYITQYIKESTLRYFGGNPSANCTRSLHSFCNLVKDGANKWSLLLVNFNSLGGSNTVTINNMDILFL